jgi:hypothetical protein
MSRGFNHYFSYKFLEVPPFSIHPYTVTTCTKLHQNSRELLSLDISFGHPNYLQPKERGSTHTWEEKDPPKEETLEPSSSTVSSICDIVFFFLLYME